jgi:hypothetical protein
LPQRLHVGRRGGVVTGYKERPRVGTDHVTDVVGDIVPSALENGDQPRNNAFAMSVEITRQTFAKR